MITGTWFKINDRWYVDLRQIREIGNPYDDNNKAIEITFNDGKEVRYNVDDADEVLKRFIKMTSGVSQQSITNSIIKGEDYVV